MKCIGSSTWEETFYNTTDRSCYSCIIEFCITIIQTWGGVYIISSLFYLNKIIYKLKSLLIISSSIWYSWYRILSVKDVEVTFYTTSLLHVMTCIKVVCLKEVNTDFIHLFHILWLGMLKIKLYCYLTVLYNLPHPLLRNYEKKVIILKFLLRILVIVQ